MAAAKGILTARGGMTSHAALVARQMGKVCVAGCSGLEIDYAKKTMTVGKIVLKEGDDISIDGSSGEVFNGNIPTKPSEVVQVLITRELKPDKAPLYKIYEQLMTWADKYRRLNVRTNADQPDQAVSAVRFGAEGIGLCRTEHMFFGEGKNNTKINAVREMILADDEESRRKALKKLLPLQRKDFEGIFKAMNGLPVTIRTLDPPLHEFLPHEPAQVAELAKQMNVTAPRLLAKIETLKESNPMLGHRGCRLGIVYPEITEMQVEAIITAAINMKKAGIKVLPEIMIPLVGHCTELVSQTAVVHR
ncbi:MAG: putative PEP-binding protein, partial [Lentisphaerota bacterium]